MAKTNGSVQGRSAPKQERQRPAHEVRLGRVKGAIWANATDQGVRYGVSLTRLYKDDQSGEWRNSTSFGRDDLLLVAQVCQMALVWIYQESQEAQQRQHGESGQDDADIPF